MTSHPEITTNLYNETKSVDVDVESKLVINNLDAGFNTQVLKNIKLAIEENSVTAFIGPSGCGKTTLLRCINRMHEMTPGAYAKGEIFLDKINIYDKKVNPVMIKRRIGMVFQKPNPFPTMSIYDNVAAGLKLNGVKDKKIINEIVRESLEGAALWEEVKDELNKTGNEFIGWTTTETMYSASACYAT